jgi:putative transposase
MRQIEEDAKKLTKTVRRQNERKRLGLANARSHVDTNTRPPEVPVSDGPPPVRDIRPFDDIDDMQDDKA